MRPLLFVFGCLCVILSSAFADVTFRLSPYSLLTIPALSWNEIDSTGIQDSWILKWSPRDRKWHARADSTAAGGAGEANTGSNLGGGLANYSTKIGVDLRFNSFQATDFDLAANLFALDYTNGQAAGTTLKGFLTSADWNTFNNKAPSASPTFTGTVTIPTPFTLGATSVTPTGTELNYVDGVTSGIQGQLDDKQASLGFTPENSANKNAASGYAGLTAGTKITAAQGQEIWSSSDLTDFGDKSGTGTTAIGSTITTPVSGEALKWDGTKWTNQTDATGAGGGITTLKKTASQTINSGAGVFTDVTDLTFAVTNGVSYAFHFYVTFQSASTATGWRCGVNCPAGTLDFWAESPTVANSAVGAATHTERHNTVRDDMTLLTATITAGVDLAVRIEGRYLCAATGTFAVRFANELISNTDIVVQKGSWGWYF